MSGHLPEEQLSGYIHQTLTDARREEIDRHLAACPDCRARLADYEALQRHIRHDLLADLRAAQPPPTMTFAAIAPQMKRVRRTAILWEQSQQALSVTAALIVMIVQAIILMALFRSVNQAGNVAPTIQPLAAAPPGVRAEPASPDQVSGEGQLPDGWFSGGNQQGYAIGVDCTVARSGNASGTIKSKVPQPTGPGILMQMFRADEYRGKRIRTAAYIRAEDVTGKAYLWVRVDGAGKEMLRFDDTQGTPVQDTTGWEPVDVILDVPEDSVTISFGVLLDGPGQIWVDDFQFDVVD